MGMTEDLQNYIDLATEHAAVTLLWQASDASEDGNGFPITESGNEYSDMVLDKFPYLGEMVRAFVTQNQRWLDESDVSPEDCGHNLILTANHHGVGFWDRGYKWGNLLTESAHGYNLDAEFALNEDGDVVWLRVDNTILVGNEYFEEN